MKLLNEISEFFFHVGLNQLFDSVVLFMPFHFDDWRRKNLLKVLVYVVEKENNEESNGGCSDNLPHLH